MGSRFRLLFSIALGLCMPVALAQTATTTTSVTVRAGPDRSMPSVTTLLSNTSVNVAGCVANWSWCDVIAGCERGWVSTRYRSVPFEGTALTIANGGPRLGLPVLEFALGPYWDEHYPQRLWFAQKSTWQRRWDQQRPPSPWRDPAAARS